MQLADFPWLTTLIVVPLIGSLLLWALPAGARRFARQIALAVSLVVVALGVLVALRFDMADSGTHQLTEQAAWIPQFGVSYALGVDGVGLLLILLTVGLVPLVLLAAWREHAEDAARQRTYAALILLTQAMLIAVFAARDVFLFYVLFEAMLIPVYFLIGGFGGPQRRYAAVKFLLYSLAGGLIMLVAVIALYFQGPGGPDGFLIDNLVGVEMATGVERWLFLGFFIAFAIKAPMWPVHTWLPDAAEQAPAGTSTLLVGIMDKVGTFGMLTLCLPLFPEASRWAAPVIMVLAVVSILYGALVAIGQADLMRLIAYTSVSHFGFIVLGIFAFTEVGIQGSSTYMLNHGLSTAAMFLLAGMLISRRGSQLIGDFGGLQKITPVLAGTFLASGLAMLSLPGLSPFVSEFLVIVGTFEVSVAAGVGATLGVILAALYILLTYQRMFTGPVREELRSTPDLSTRERWVIGPLVAAMLVFGFYPSPLLDAVRAPAQTSAEQVAAAAPAGPASDTNASAEGSDQ